MTSDTQTTWHRFDSAASGLIYGAIMVLGILMAAGDSPDAPFETAAVLFGSVLAITLAKAFAELLAHSLESGARVTRQSWRDAWNHSSPTLAVANLPTLLFATAGMGCMSAELAGSLSQGLCVALLILMGFRVGWVIDKRTSSAILGGIFAGAVGLVLAVMKHLIH